MMEKKGVSKLNSEEMGKIKKALGNALKVYGKGNSNMKKQGLRILDSWGRIIFIISNDGKRIGLELTERWERERNADKGERSIYP